MELKQFYFRFRHRSGSILDFKNEVKLFYFLFRPTLKRE
jgi:hypothetical protein